MALVILLSAPVNASTVCARADRTAAAVSKVNPANPHDLVTAAGAASKASSDCAIEQFAQHREPVGFAYMATSFHNANIAAMGMHLEGDDASARRLTQLTLSAEETYIRRARDAHDDNAVSLLASTRTETSEVAQHF